MNWRLVIPVAVAVVAIWLVGAAITKYSLEEMAYFAPIAVLVVGATVGLVLLWVKVVTQSLRQRRERRGDAG
ncbi:MAG TPA: hypothetical protein VH950_18815 [Gaiellaceae bacterium]